jgi:hypothetical protein
MTNVSVKKIVVEGGSYSWGGQRLGFYATFYLPEECDDSELHLRLVRRLADHKVFEQVRWPFASYWLIYESCIASVMMNDLLKDLGFTFFKMPLKDTLLHALYLRSPATLSPR